ncbi:MAG TPA: hypothetical protein VNQ77_11930 [Frankiaceae bacterium]|nr:hypothetical protein [Frankiaceae bacterium]
MTATSLREETSLVYRFDADADGAFWLVRQLVEQFLRERHVRSDAIPDLLLVTTELCTGAVAGVVLRVFVEDYDVDIVVESCGGVVLDRPQGDLRLAASMCDEVIVRVTPEQTVVRARRHGVVLL